MIQTNPNRPQPDQAPAKPGQQNQPQPGRNPDKSGQQPDYQRDRKPEHDDPRRGSRFDKPGGPDRKQREPANPPYDAETD